MQWKNTGIFICLFTLIFMSAACSKDDDPRQEPLPEEEAADPALFNTLVRVNNLQATQSNETSAASTLYFSLETKKQYTAEHAQTRNWDLAFSGLFNSFLSGNNGQNSNNFGFGGSATGGILIVEKSFDEVIDIPSDNDFKTGSTLVGTDNYGDFGEGMGWYLYDFEGSIVRDGATQNQHVAYALVNPLTLSNGTVVKPRTIILRTAKGNYAKIRILSCYKDLLEPSLWLKDAPKMYFTFEYVLVPAGSSSFTIK
ncbi:HmuY family protein [Sphingobacterium bambusae]|uniref:HmuY family protein n=1 Tax=Sphingobacterium bambusae TaxID=662858 RepID=A0ABW6BL46_9SPHI|nr:HmuY family protein [Sphingobacterium bambusae]WPL48987.1 HmuY family protein [Sphingobacterium bambusae]